MLKERELCKTAYLLRFIMKKTGNAVSASFFHPNALFSYKSISSSLGMSTSADMLELNKNKYIELQYNKYVQQAKQEKPCKKTSIPQRQKPLTAG